jgi:hypothetical protein
LQQTLQIRWRKLASSSNNVTQRVGSTHAEKRIGKSRTEGISPTETSGADIEAVKRRRPRSTRSWSRPAAGARGCGHREQLPMDAGSRGSRRQPATRAPRLAVASHAPPRDSASPRPSRRPRPQPSFTVESPSSLTPATRMMGCNGRPAVRLGYFLGHISPVARRRESGRRLCRRYAGSRRGGIASEEPGSMRGGMVSGEQQRAAA